MDKKQMYVQVVNLNTGKMFSLPTLYTDRTEACIGGQNYIRDRQTENPSELLFFRVLDVRENGEIAPEYYLWDDQLEEEKDEFDWENPACQSSRKTNTNGEDFALQMVMGLIDYICEHCPEASDASDAPEEPSTESLAEILSVFNAMTLNP